MPLTDEEWEKISDTICDVANEVYSEDVLLYQLKRLRLKHGELPILLSTEADFIDSIEDRLSLYKKAVDLSLQAVDVSCLTQSAESLAEIYIEKLSDYENGSIWVGKLKEYVALYGDEHILSSLGDLEAGLKRLKIQLV